MYYKPLKKESILKEDDTKYKIFSFNDDDLNKEIIEVLNEGWRPLDIADDYNIKELLDNIVDFKNKKLLCEKEEDHKYKTIKIKTLGDNNNCYVVEIKECVYCGKLSYKYFQL